MYSLVMMTALTAGPNIPEFNGFFRNAFNHGGNCSGCSGAPSTSNTAAGCCGGFGSRIRTFFSFGSGCCGSSCSGSGSGSCSGRAAAAPPPQTYAVAPAYSGSCCGGGVAYAPSYSCCGGGMPSNYGAPYGGFNYAQPEFASYSGCYGSGMPYAGPMMNTGPSYPMPAPGNFAPNQQIPPTNLPGGAVPFAPPMTAPPADVREDRNYPRNVLPAPAGPTLTRATVVVKLPTDAKLYAENQLLNLSSAERTFVTPELPLNREYSYTFKIEYDRGGRTITEAQKVSVQAGKIANVEFIDYLLAKTAPATPKTMPAAIEPMPTPAPTATVKTNSLPSKNSNPFTMATAPIVPPAPMVPAMPQGPARAKISVKVPVGATLFIDGRKNDGTEAVREFNTPPLPAGKEFSYLMMVETNRDGRPEQLMQKVVFRAGEDLTVDLTIGKPDANSERRASSGT